MVRTITVIYEQGVFRPLEELDLPERQKFQITIQPAPEDQQTLADALGFDPNDEEKLQETGKRQREAWLKMAGTFTGTQQDVSRRHDYYIYIEPYEQSTHEQS